MRRVLVLESEPEARSVIRDVASALGYAPLLFWHEEDARRAWGAGIVEPELGGTIWHAAILDGRPHDAGFDLARLIRASALACMVILTVDDTSVTYQACDAIGAACVARAKLRAGLARELR